MIINCSTTIFLPVFRACKRTASIGSIYMEPGAMLLADRSDLTEVVEGYRACGAEGGADLEKHVGN